jgi:UDP-N-acetylmuramate dehydrogenase
VPPLLADLTTLRIGGPAARIVTATSRDGLVDAVRSADAAGEPVLVLGGGSNLVAADAGWPGTVVLIRTTGIDRRGDGDRVLLTVAAGTVWDEVAEQSVRDGLTGTETMSGIPGLAGATPVQNVGAYGNEVSDVLSALTVLDRATGTVERWTPERCGFGFRTSAFKHTDRYVVLDITLALERIGHSRPVRYLELARRLGVEPGGTAPLAQVRDVVLELRRSKGMLLDPDDHDTWSVGSFFVNPFVSPELVPDGCPSWTVDGRIKLSAAWLIERAGFAKGYHGGRARVSVSTKHTLALTNRGGASAAELLELAAEIRAGVEDRFGIRLRPEAHLAGLEF